MSGNLQATDGGSTGQPSTCTGVQRKLKRTALTLSPPKGPPSSRFKLLQWNILADGLAQHGDFVKVPPEVLEWDYRMPLMMAEVTEAGADVICIQELNHYEELLRKLQPLGYDGTFLPKHCSPAARYQCPADGLAVFHNTKRFQRIGEPQGHIYLDANGQRESQGFLQVRLRDLCVDRELVIATTHLKSKEGVAEEQKRTRQIRQLLHHLKRELLGETPSMATAAAVPAVVGSMTGTLTQVGPLGDIQACPLDSTTLSDSDAEMVPASAAGFPASNSNDNGSSNGNSSSNGNGSSSNSHGSDNGDANGNGTAGAAGAPGTALPAHLSVPVIIAGDFNATPESVPCKEMKAHPAGFQSIWDVKPFRSLDLDQSSGPVGNGSVDELTGMSLDDKEFSTWKFRSKGESKRIIDHVWYTRERALYPISRWRMLTEEEIGPTALPCPAYASDHLALCCEFEWRDL